MVKRSSKKAIEKDKSIIAPAQNVQNRIAFIFNNLSQLNLQTKVNIYSHRIKFVKMCHRSCCVLIIRLFLRFVRISVWRNSRHYNRWMFTVVLELLGHEARQLWIELPHVVLQPIRLFEKWSPEHFDNIGNRTKY